MAEQLSPERAARLLRAKAAELEDGVKQGFTIREDYLAADIALVAGLLADHIERSERHDEQLRQMYEFLLGRKEHEQFIAAQRAEFDIDDANVRDMRDGRS